MKKKTVGRPREFSDEERIERAKEKSRRYYKANKKKCIKRAKKYQKTHKEQTKATRKRYDAKRQSLLNWARENYHA